MSGLAVLDLLTGWTHKNSFIIRVSWSLLYIKFSATDIFSWYQTQNCLHGSEPTALVLLQCQSGPAPVDTILHKPVPSEINPSYTSITSSIITQHGWVSFFPIKKQQRRKITVYQRKAIPITNQPAIHPTRFTFWYWISKLSNVRIFRFGIGCGC
jgi:hypothetical protein